MTQKWSNNEIEIGAVLTTLFEPNPISDKFPYRATQFNGKPAPKIVLCADRRVPVGVPCRVRVKAMRKLNRTDRGMIEVAFLEALPGELNGVYVPQVVAWKIRRLLNEGKNIMLDGPQGCGKNTLVQAIARSLNLEFVYFNCSAVVESSDFMATLQMQAGPDGKAVVGFVKTPMLLTLEEAKRNPRKRYLIFLDEFNRCRESARNALMPALDAIRRIFNPVDNTFLAVPDNVQFTAAVNRGRAFSGAFGIDPAQLDRFAPIQMEYMPVEKELEHLNTMYPEAPGKLVKLIVTTADRVRRKAELNYGLSVRATEEACLFFADPESVDDPVALLPEVLKDSFCGRFPGRWSDPTSEAGMVWAIVQATIREEFRGKL